VLRRPVELARHIRHYVRVMASTIEVGFVWSYILPMRTVLPATLFLLFFGLAATGAQDRSKAKPDWFDVPLSKKTVDFGPSFTKPSDTSPAWQWNAYRRARNTLTCYWFPTVMVKEYDISQKGAEWTSFIRIAGKAHPECTLSHVPGEKVVDKESEWIGYFAGVKEDFIFLSDADGDNGGIGFGVYDSRTGKKVFEDTDCLTCMYLKKAYGKEPLSAPFDRMRLSKVQGGLVTLKYLRVEQADCDLRGDKASCWDHVRMQMDVKSAKAPVCLGYAHTPAGELPSMVAHPVFVSLGSPPVVKGIDGPVLCWAPD
jgi:hypothetical protein